ncbi:SDR family oxidoreductase [Bacillus smithii]|uniref:SDR family oxidoreductase n=1 Tax=Bacillus smithii TaxID=1479 RepID=UPI0030C9CAF5
MNANPPIQIEKIHDDEWRNPSKNFCQEEEEQKNINEQLVARSFVREGAQVIINDCQSKEKAEKWAEELRPRALALQGDVRSKEDMENLFRKAEEHFGKSVS